MRRFIFIIATLAVAFTPVPVLAEPEEGGETPVAAVTALDFEGITRADKRNLGQMLERGLIRILVPYSRTFATRHGERSEGA